MFTRALREPSSETTSNGIRESWLRQSVKGLQGVHFYAKLYLKATTVCRSGQDDSEPLVIREELLVRTCPRRRNFVFYIRFPCCCIFILSHSFSIAFFLSCLLGRSGREAGMRASRLKFLPLKDVFSIIAMLRNVYAYRRALKNLARSS